MKHLPKLTVTSLHMERLNSWICLCSILLFFFSEASRTINTIVLTDSKSTAVYLYRSSWHTDQMIHLLTCIRKIFFYSHSGCQRTFCDHSKHWIFRPFLSIHPWQIYKKSIGQESRTGKHINIGSSPTLVTSNKMYQSQLNWYFLFDMTWPDMGICPSSISQQVDINKESHL